MSTNFKSSRNKLKVGIFTNDFSFFGGQGRHIHELCKQNEHFDMVEYLVFSPLNTVPSSIEKAFKNLGFSSWMNRSINSLIKQNSLDLVHIHGGPGGLFLLHNPNVPVIYTCHHTYWQQIHYIRSEFWKLPFFLLERISYRKARKVICVSEDTERYITSVYKIASSNSIVIPNGINHKFRSSGNRLTYKTLLFVGRLDKRKGIDFLVNSMNLMKDERPELHLDIVGDGKLRKSLSKYSTRQKLNVTFHGRLSDKALNNLYKTAVAQIVPSVFEGFGIVVLEGMSKGIPIIATNADGIRGIIKNGHNGILIEYGDQRKLIEAIVTVTENQEMSEKIVANAYKTIESKKYSWINIYRKTINVYKRIH